MSREIIVEALRTAAEKARYQSHQGLGMRGFADYHIKAFVCTAAPEIERFLADEREKVREMCARRALKYMATYPKSARADICSLSHIAAGAAKAIRQLDLTKDLAPTTDEGKGGQR